jgi:hypothetical protein
MADGWGEGGSWVHALKPRRRGMDVVTLGGWPGGEVLDPPPPLRVTKAGRNHWKEAVTPILPTPPTPLPRRAI